MNSKLVKMTASSVVLGAALMGCTTSNGLSRPFAASQKSARATARPWKRELGAKSLIER
jgi:hypothetical protein